MPPIRASKQVRRLLVMVPWLVERREVPLEEVADAFGITVQQAEADVIQASLIGVPPYDPGSYVDIYLDEGWVHAHPGNYLVRPPQLTPRQGFALLASAKGLLAYQTTRGDGPLGTALQKLERVLGDASAIEVDLQAPPQLGDVRDACHRGHQLRITYYAAWRDEETERIVDPHVVYERNGRWYVEAWCHTAGDTRRFRVDRIRAMERTGVTFDPVRKAPPDDVWDPGEGAEEVVVDLPASARWVVEAYPVTSEPLDGGRVRVTMRVVGTAWLERLLLRAGPEAVVVSPASMRDVGRDAARRLLEAYA